MASDTAFVRLAADPSGDCYIRIDSIVRVQRREVRSGGSLVHTADGKQVYTVEEPHEVMAKIDKALHFECRGEPA